MIKNAGQSDYDQPATITSLQPENEGAAGFAVLFHARDAKLGHR
jgi:hypothetical protein